MADEATTTWQVGTSRVCFGYDPPFPKIYAPQTKILECRKIVRWVVFEVLFILASAIFGLTVMKSTSKTTHRTIFRRSKIFVWPSPLSDRLWRSGSVVGHRIDILVVIILQTLYNRSSHPKKSTHRIAILL